jgi:CxxC-x17-CxxC domain-containing protein
MHAATCAECGVETEVPFRPSGERPVYCRDCFGRQQG